MRISKIVAIVFLFFNLSAYAELPIPSKDWNDGFDEGWEEGHQYVADYLDPCILDDILNKEVEKGIISKKEAAHIMRLAEEARFKSNGVDKKLIKKLEGQ